MTLFKKSNDCNSEIGSEFWNVPVSENVKSIFPDNTVWYLSGRCALRAIIKDIKRRIDFKKVALPSWCCDSMIIPFLEEEVEVKFYSVHFEDGLLKKDFTDISDCNAILLMDYFGFKRVFHCDFGGIIINDVTHSVFCSEFADADYTFGSLRKWAGFYTGGFAFSNKFSLQTQNAITDSEFVAMRKLAMSEKQSYIIGNSCSKDYLSKFSCAEDILEKYSCGVADADDILRAERLDTDFIIKKRRENASVIMKEFVELTAFSELGKNDCPLFVPLFIPNGKRDELRKYLIKKKIYCPVHWPVSEFHKLNEKTKTVYEQEISIICDQRYSISDMEHICNCINNFLR